MNATPELSPVLYPPTQGFPASEPAVQPAGQKRQYEEDLPRAVSARTIEGPIDPAALLEMVRSGTPGTAGRPFSVAQVLPVQPALPASANEAAQAPPTTEPGPRAFAPLSVLRRNPPPTIFTFKLENVQCKAASRPTKQGKPTINIYDLSNQRPPKVALSTTDDGVTLRDPPTIPFGLETAHPQREPPSFLGGPAGRVIEGLDLTINLTEEQADFLENVERFLKKVVCEHSKEWLGSELHGQEIDHWFTSTIKRSKEYAPSFRAQVVLVAPPDRAEELTTVNIVEPSGEVRTGKGWEFVQATLGSSKWKRGSVWAVVEFRNMWVGPRAFGLRCSYKELTIREKPSTAHSSFFTPDILRSLAQPAV